jgi:hypothetical protein
MTIEEFNNTRWVSGMRAKYKEQEYGIITVDFQENLIGLDIVEDGQSIDWVRCENVELINSEKSDSMLILSEGCDEYLSQRCDCGKYCEYGKKNN